MLELQHANHCVYKIRYHMVFCVKYRKKLLSNSRYWFQFDTIGTDGDHVHLFVGAEPKYALSKVMQIIKSITTKQMFKAFPEIRKEL